ncbi:MAG: hypothetical protein ACLUW6_00485 [Coriobacteriaceae bacterium]
MGLDEELESMEEVARPMPSNRPGTELEDAEDDEDALFDADEEDAAESDLEHAYDSFMTRQRGRLRRLGSRRGARGHPGRGGRRHPALGGLSH